MKRLTKKFLRDILAEKFQGSVMVSTGINEVR